jgi:hypothetical protein
LSWACDAQQRRGHANGRVAMAPRFPHYIEPPSPFARHLR